MTEFMTHNEALELVSDMRNLDHWTRSWLPDAPHTINIRQISYSEMVMIDEGEFVVDVHRDGEDLSYPRPYALTILNVHGSHYGLGCCRSHTSNATV